MWDNIGKFWYIVLAVWLRWIKDLLKLCFEVQVDRDTSDWPIDRFPGTKGSSNANVLLFFWYRERVGSRYGCISHDQYQNRKETAKTHCYDYVSGSFDLSAIAVQTVE